MIFLKPSITEHQQDHCESCRGAAFHQSDHYALGRLRMTIGHELRLSRESEQELTLPELLGRWARFKREQTVKATKALLDLEDPRDD